MAESRSFLSSRHPGSWNVLCALLRAADKIIDTISPGKGVDKQSKAASDLIKARKENGVKKMKITMDEQADAHLDVPVEGVKVSAGIGSKGKTTIEVEYA